MILKNKNIATHDYPFDLGRYHRPISTKSRDAQIWFDRGLNWIYGYNHEEAVFCFEQGLKYDQECVMLYWGMAYASGPNYNLPWEFFEQPDLEDTLIKCRNYLSSAEQHVMCATPLERSLLGALRLRYPQDNASDDLYAWSDSYAIAMREIYRDYSEDPDVSALYAEAMMNRTPWRLWDPVTGRPVDGADTLKIQSVLERSIVDCRAQGLHHPGLWHLYVHCMEMSPKPEVALKISDELRTLIPDAGHIYHMATHIYVQCGEYSEVVAWNQAGIERDLKYYAYAGAQNFYSIYRAHNYHFKIYGAMLLGQYDQAIQAAKEMRSTIGDEVISAESPAVSGWLEAYMSLKTHVLVRFGKWKACTEEDLPADTDLYPMTTAMVYYGRAIGHANLKEISLARANQELFINACQAVPENQLLHTVPCRDILEVGKYMLAGEIEYHAGFPQIGFENLRKAVELEDSLPYDEPWPWMMPTRHALAALLIDQGEWVEAIDIYESDLGLNDKVIRANRHPNNIWALVGLHKAYKKSGRVTDARRLKASLDYVAARADISINASCFCSQQG